MTQPYRALIDAFGRAWEEGNVEGVLAVFSPDAVFQESPYGPKDKGTAAIRSYWKDLPANQAEVSFRSGEIYAAGPWFATEFHCTYRRRRTGQRVDTKGAIFCETKEGKISEMRLYWHRKD